MRSKTLPYTFFHYPRHNVEKYRYLCMRVKGDARQWFVNIQSDSLFPKSLYQHKIEFKTVGEWETIMVCYDGLCFRFLLDLLY